MPILSDDQVTELARKVMEIDEKPNAVLPPFILAEFTKFVNRYPNDTNFIVEISEKGAENKFGTAVCLEDYCWTDVVLGTDPNMNDGGFARGFGSLWEYEMHCKGSDHQRGCMERCRKAGVTYEPKVVSQYTRPLPTSSSAPTRTDSSQGGAGTSHPHGSLAESTSSTSISQGAPPARALKAHASSSSASSRGPRSILDALDEPLRPTTTSSQRSQDSSATIGPLQDTSRHNIPSSSQRSSSSHAGPSQMKDIKPVIRAFDMSDDEEEGVKVLEADEIPLEMRRKTNRDAPVIISDDEEDVQPNSKGKARQIDTANSTRPTNGEMNIKGAAARAVGANAFERMKREQTLASTSLKTQNSLMRGGSGQIGKSLTTEPMVDAAKNAALAAADSVSSGSDPVARHCAELKRARDGVVKTEIDAVNHLIRKYRAAAVNTWQHKVCSQLRQHRTTLNALLVGPPETTYPPMPPYLKSYCSSLVSVSKAASAMHAKYAEYCRRVKPRSPASATSAVKAEPLASSSTPTTSAASGTAVGPSVTSQVDPSVRLPGLRANIYQDQRDRAVKKELDLIAIAEHQYAGLQTSYSIEFRTQCQARSLLLRGLIAGAADSRYPPLEGYLVSHADVRTASALAAQEEEAYLQYDRYLLAERSTSLATGPIAGTHTDIAPAPVAKPSLRVPGVNGRTGVDIKPDIPGAYPGLSLVPTFPDSSRLSAALALYSAASGVGTSAAGAALDWGSPYYRLQAAAQDARLDGIDMARVDLNDADEDAIMSRHYEWDRPNDLQEFFTSALADFSEDHDIDTALGKLGLENLQQKFADMTVTLLPHQVLGVSFMLDKEKDSKFRGGLLCDAMGLGKTVQTIAVLAGNRSQDRRVKTTLIVAPLAVLQQWRSEIENKTADGLFSVLIHHGATKAKTTNALKNVDVVLTTYGTLVSEFAEPKTKKKKKRKEYDSDGILLNDSGSDEPIKKAKGPMFKMRWFRVVLDEAHTIRNRQTQMSLAAADLDSVHRWCLTGTLVNNSLDDIFPHLRFLSISTCADWKEFNKRISKPQKKHHKLATQRIQAILKTCMMRRHKESMLNGQKLLQLPPKETSIEELDFMEEERSIYTFVENRMKIKFGTFLKQGTVLKHMSCILTMLMRLRQVCCHPWLLRRNPGDPEHPNDFTISDEELFHSLNIPFTNAGVDLNRAVGEQGNAWVEDMAKRLRERNDRYTNQAKRDDEADKENECSICLDLFTDETVTVCKHSYCKTCITEIFENPPRDGADLTDVQLEKGMRKCPMCRAVIDKTKLYAAVAFFNPEKEQEKDEKPVITASGSGADRKGKRKSLENEEDDDEFADKKPDIKKVLMGNKGKGKARAEVSDDEDDAKTRPDTVLASTKMKMLCDLIDEYLQEPEIKVIVFSEFVSFLDLCGILLSQRNIPHSMYHGGMRQNDRVEVIREFTSPIVNERSPRVMLISRKAGGAGLNLTVASKVISLDLAWNAAAENQAVDRAHRIGQTRPVNVKRLVIADTVEQRILDLQARKEALSDGAMGEGTGGRLGRLSVRDLMKLFDYNAEADD